jgi:hypothetical protein
VDDHHCLDRPGAVLRERGLDNLWIDAVPPVAGHEVQARSPARRHLPPEGREVPGLEHQHPVAGRQGVQNGRFPGPRVGGRVDDDLPLGLEDGLAAFQDVPSELGEFGAAMIGHLLTLKSKASDRRKPGDVLFR